MCRTCSYQVCDGRCIDTTRDLANCGGCGKPCAAGQTCRAGTCR
jgi:hypothetical protein